MYLYSLKKIPVYSSSRCIYIHCRKYLYIPVQDVSIYTVENTCIFQRSRCIYIRCRKYLNIPVQDVSEERNPNVIYDEGENADRHAMITVK